MFGGRVPVFVKGDKTSNEMGSIAGVPWGAGGEKLIGLPFEGLIKFEILVVGSEERREDWGGGDGDWLRRRYGPLHSRAPDDPRNQE
jgi:hypothetical protein